jgi:nucleoside-diphosphate-sugar epimerase
MIFVSGGTGFLGRHLVPVLCRAGHAVRILTRNPHENNWLRRYPNVEIVSGDLESGDGLQHVAGCSMVIHAAGLFRMWNMAGDFQAINVRGTQRLLDRASEYGVRRFVYVSTVAVIGNPTPGIPIDEEHLPRPADAYQVSKLQAEQLVQQYHEDARLETVIVRPGAFYGPLGDYGFNRLFFTDPMRGIIMQMDGGHYVIFPAYIGDVARGIQLALERGKTGERYNICGETLSHRAAFDIICQEADLHFPRLNIPGLIGISFAQLLTQISRITRREPFYPINLRSYVFNDWDVTSAKAQRELGFVPTPFRDGARRTIDWYRAGKPDMIPELICDGNQVNS